MAHISSAAYVTAVLRFLQAYNRGDMDVCEQLLDPSIEWHSAADYVGRSEVRAMLESARARFTNPQARPEDFREAGGHVLIIVCFYEADGETLARTERQSWIADLTDDASMIKRVLAFPSPADAARAFESLAAGAPKVHA